MSGNANLTNEEKLTKAKERKNKRARRTARFRPLKNLIWWFCGVISSFVILAGAVAVVVCAVPVETFLNLFGVEQQEDNKLVSDKISSGSLLNAGMNIGTFTVGDLPVVTDALLKTFPEYTEYEKPSGFDPTLDSVPRENLYILEGDEYLNAFDEEGNYINSASPSSTLYHRNTDNLTKLLFGAEEDGGLNMDEIPFSDFATTGLDKIKGVQIAKLLRAIGYSNFIESVDDGGEVTPTLIGEFLGDVTIAGLSEMDFNEQLKGVSLYSVGIDDNEQLSELLTAVTQKDDIKDVKLGDLIDEELVFDDVKLSTLLEPSEFETVYEILSELSGVTVYDNITVGDLQGELDFNGIKLSTVLDVTEGADIYEILLDIVSENNDADLTNDLTAAEITVGHLTGINVDSLKLSVFLPIEGNTELYDILVDAVNAKTTPVGTKTAADIIVDDLNGIQVDNVKLTTVLKEEGNDKLYSILRQATGKTTNDEITLAHLSSFNVDNVKLTTVLKEEGNDKLYSILRQATGKTTNDEITIDSLGSFNVSNVKLTAVLEEEGNDKLYSILRQTTGKTTNDEITIDSLGSFNVDNIKLTTVLPLNSGNEKLYNILKDVTGQTDVNNILVGNLSSFNIDNIKFSTVISNANGNKIFEALLEDDTATVGTLATKINELDFCEIYGHECFENYVTGSGKAEYVKVLDKDGKHGDYVLRSIYELYPAKFNVIGYVDGSNTEIQYYQVSSGAGVWLFMMYHEMSVDASGNLVEGGTLADANGNAIYYEYKAIKASGLETGVDVSDSIMNATVKQFIDAGLITQKPEDPIDSKLYKYTIKQAIEMLNDFASLIS